MERLTSDRLKQEQEKTLAAPRMRYGLLSRLLFLAMDLLYGRRRTLSKFKESRVQQDNEQWHLLILEELTDKKGIHP